MGDRVHNITIGTAEAGERLDKALTSLVPRAKPSFSASRRRAPLSRRHKTSR